MKTNLQVTVIQIFTPVIIKMYRKQINYGKTFEIKQKVLNTQKASSN